jgi:hypothetical protein
MSAHAAAHTPITYRLAVDMGNFSGRIISREWEDVKKAGPWLVLRFRAPREKASTSC